MPTRVKYRGIRCPIGPGEASAERCHNCQCAAVEAAIVAASIPCPILPGVASRVRCANCECPNPEYDMMRRAHLEGRGEPSKEALDLAAARIREIRDRR